MNDYISVPEFAKRAGITAQAVYKQIKNPKSKIAPFLLEDGKQVLIKISALKKLYGVDTTKGEELNPELNQIKPAEVEYSTQETTGLNPMVENDSTPFNPELNPVKPQDSTQAPGVGMAQIIQVLQEQLREKDKQIERLQAQTQAQAEENRKKDKVIQEQLEKLNDLLKNAQQLQAQSNILLLGEKRQEEQPGPEPDINQDSTQATPEPEKPRSWFYNIFYRKMGR